MLLFVTMSSKSDLWCFNSAPVAVGVSTMSSQEMFDCGMKGKGVIINHWYTDNLW